MTMRVLTLGLLMATSACSMTPKLALPAPPVAATYPIEVGGEAVPSGRACLPILGYRR